MPASALALLRAKFAIGPFIRAIRLTAEPKTPLAFRGFLWFFGMSFAIGIIAKVIIRLTPVAAVVSREVAQAFENREIRREELPPEFRFITHDMRLQEVIDKLGEPSRILKVPINAERGLGYALVSGDTSDAAIVAYEYGFAISRCSYRYA